MNRLAELRKRLNMSQPEMAADAGIGTSTIAMAECGARPLSAKTALILSKKYGVSVDWLLGVDNPLTLNEERNRQIQEFVSSVTSNSPDSFKADLLSVLSRLGETEWMVLADIAEAMYREQEKKKG